MWALLITVRADSEPIQGSYTDNFVVANNVPPGQEFNRPPKRVLCSCVNTAKWLLGKEGEVWGNASQLLVTTQKPVIGALVLTTEGPGHAGVVASVSADGLMVHILEGNYSSCQYSERELEVNSPVIRGFRVVP